MGSSRVMTQSVFVVVMLLTLLCGSGLTAPDTCRTAFDAVARVRGELFFFKDDYFWRLSRAGHLMTRRPVEMGSFWIGLPERATINAAYERPDGSVVFFCGRHFWVFWDRRAKPGYPRPLSDLGLPEETRTVDAAFFSGHNEGTYLITGDMYWRFNERTGKVETDSPQPISRLCRGLPRKLDAAFTDNGQTYFIQGQHYWRCDSAVGRVQSYTPDLVAPRWLGCSLLQCCLRSLDDSIDTKVLWAGRRMEELDEPGDAAGPLSAPRGALVAAGAVVWAAWAAL